MANFQILQGNSRVFCHHSINLVKMTSIQEQTSEVRGRYTRYPNTVNEGMVSDVRSKLVPKIFGATLENARAPTS